MTLAELISPWISSNHLNCEITGLANDSRQIRPGFLFLAYPGAATDGRLFIKEAIKAGAIAVLYEPEHWPSHCGLPTETVNIAFPGLAEKLADIAIRYYDEPTKKLIVTGVTGTNGKTTIAYQLAQAHELLGQDAAYIGTIGQGQVEALIPLLNTTPDALCLQRLLSNYQQNGIKQVCMEVTSHALCQNRVEGIRFQQAIFTNLSHDHLDYHHTMEAYAQAKALLFSKPTLNWAIINHDDPYSQMMRSVVKPPCQIISYGKNEGADLRVVRWSMSLKGTQMDIVSPWGAHQLEMTSLGFFNIYNTLALFASLMASGYSHTQVLSVIPKLKTSPGRMEIVMQEPYVIVDYAHTPDALENLLSTLTPLKKGRILLVFGCGGNRDKTKRPIMGRIANQYADIIIITNDNPREEEPEVIIEEIYAGINNKKNCIKILDREQAIQQAISLASPNDMIVIAGKGHESYQEIGKIRHAFSDQEVVKRLMK